MAKSKNKTVKKESVKNPKYQYKYRRKAPRKHIHNDWKTCDEDTKERLDKQYPKVFVFEEVQAETPPELTPGMEEIIKNEEKNEE